MNTDTISTGSIAVDYSKSLQDMIADGNYDWVNPAITPKGFPITAVGIVQFETTVFRPRAGTPISACLCRERCRNRTRSLTIQPMSLQR